MQAVGQALGRVAPKPAGPPIAFEDVVIVDPGQRGRAGRRPAAAGWPRVMDQPEIALEVALDGPGGEATLFFSDLAHDYVSLNAEYST